MCRLVGLFALTLLSLLSLGEMRVWSQGKSREKWIAELKAERPEQRRAAAFALGRLGENGLGAVAALADRVHKDRDAKVREASAAALAEIILAQGDNPVPNQWEAANPALRTALKGDESPSVRRSAAYALGAFGTQGAAVADILRQALQDKDPSVRQNAAWALGRLDVSDGTILADLADRLVDKNPMVRRDAATALSRIGATAARPEDEAKTRRTLIQQVASPLMDMVREEQDVVALKAGLSALALAAGPKQRERGPDLYPLLQHKDQEVARGAAFALASVGGVPARKAVPVLTAVLEDDEDEQAKLLAAVALGNVGPEAASAVNSLAAVFKDGKDPMLRTNCAIALGKIGPAAARATMTLAAGMQVPEAEEGTKRPRALEMVREQAGEALANIEYPGNKAAVKIFRDVLRKDKNPLVRQRCVWAMFKAGRDLESLDFVAPLEAVLNETDDMHLMVRYDSARLLAAGLQDQAPDKAVEVLLHMLTNTDLFVFKGTGAVIDNTAKESTGGAASTTLSRGGDARFMAAEALGWMGKKSADNPTVVSALRKAARDKEKTLQKHAREALTQLKVPLEDEK